MTMSSGKRASAWDSVRGMWPSGIGFQFSLDATSPGDSSLTAQSALHLASGQQQHLELSGWFSSFPRRAPCFAMNLLTSFACTVSAGWQSFLILPYMSTSAPTGDEIRSSVSAFATLWPKALKTNGPIISRKTFFRENLRTLIRWWWHQ